MKTFVLCSFCLILIGIWVAPADAQHGAVGGMHSVSPGFDGRERGSGMSRPESGFGEEQREQFRQFPSERGEEFQEQGERLERRGEQREQRNQFGRGGEFASQNRSFGMRGESSEGEETEFGRESGRDETFENRGFSNFEGE